MWYVDWQSDEREVMFHSMLFWKAKFCGNAIRREDSDVPNPLSQSSGTDYQAVVTNMGRKYTEIDHGKCKLIYPRENWCLVTARNCLPNYESEGHVGDGRDLIRQHFEILFGKEKQSAWSMNFPLSLLFWFGSTLQILPGRWMVI